MTQTVPSWDYFGATERGARSVSHPSRCGYAVRYLAASTADGEPAHLVARCQGESITAG